jgi:hypothetical protein
MLTLKLVGLALQIVPQTFSIKLATIVLCSNVNLSPMAYVYLQEQNNPLMLT